MLRIFGLLFIFVVGVFSQANSDEILGVWKTKRAYVKIYKEGDAYFGKVLKAVAPTEEEKRNFEEEHGKPFDSKFTENLMILKHFKYDPEENEWIDGTLYAVPKDKILDATLQLKNRNELGVTVKPFPFVSKTVIWTRAEESE